jgi:serine/threonine protein kinase
MVLDFTKQMLEAVNFLHSMDLIHTDLKPENILCMSVAGEKKIDNGYGSKITVPASTKIKVIDFGGATFDAEHKSRIVATRQYRAPEVVLGLTWSFPSDIWSIGCIVAELYDGELFFSTHGNMEHIALMEARVGHFPPQLISKAPEGKKYFSNGRCRIDSLSRESERTVQKTCSLKKFVRREHGPFYDALQGLLRLDPSERASAYDSLQGQWAKWSPRVDIAAQSREKD